MQPHREIESTRSAALALGELVWGWEIPVYLFLGGLVAGLLLTVCAVALALGKERVTRAMRIGLLSSPVLLSVGMGALLIDLTCEAHVYRFFTTLRPHAPMSLGSWILVLVYPVELLLVLALPFEGLAAWLDRWPALGRLRSFAEARWRLLAGVGLLAAVALGTYTGVLLSATVARPLWSSGALGFLFLSSGASTGMATLMLAERDPRALALLAKADIALIGAELLVIALWLAGLATQGPAYREAVALIVRGPYAPVFLGMVVFGGLVLPAALEALELGGRALRSRAVPGLVLAGGLLLRFVVVYAGQDVGFVSG